MLDSEMIHAGRRFHHTTQSGIQFIIYELFTSEIFHLIFLNLDWLQVTETSESETMGKGKLQSTWVECEKSNILWTLGVPSR